MACISPINMPRPNGNGNKDRIQVSCGSCVFCLKERKDSWAFRLNQELKRSDSAHFLTLTYEDENLPKTDEGHATLKKDDLQRFMKRLRKANLKMAWKHLPKVKSPQEALKQYSALKYYTVGEYGSQTWRPHYHSIMFNLQKGMDTQIEKIWNKGSVLTGSVTPQSIEYVTKYVITSKFTMRTEDQQDPFALMSRGLGDNYLVATKHHVENQKTYVNTYNGSKINLPKYYKDRMWKDNQEKAILKNINYNYSLKQEKNDEIERIRIKKLGSYPAKYKQEQKQIKIKKLSKNSTKNDIL